MNIHNPKLILICFHFLFNLHQTQILATIETCSDTVCHTNQPLIRFPFYVETKQPNNTGGYPGFKVLCNQNEKNQTLLNLPSMEDFNIQKINYATQEVFVNDPNNCLPKRLLSLNLSASPFHAVYHQQFTFFNCSFHLKHLTSRYKPIPCLSHSSSNYAVFATPSLTVFLHLSSLCKLVRTVNVPVPSPFYDQVLSSELNDDLRLSWNSPSCGRCESHGGRCGFQDNSSFEIACYNVPPRQGISRGASYAIAIWLGVPAVLCFILILSWICSACRFGIHGWIWTHETVEDFESLLNLQRDTNILGLDKPTIESYTKIVIGDDGIHLPRPNDKTCSICLSEYMPKETVKTMPECEHCFHAQCIDEWLPRNASCPICRTSPPCLPSQNLAQP